MNLDLKSFHDFLVEQKNKIARAFKEVEEAQKEFQGLYTRFKTDHDKTLQLLVDAIQATPPDALGSDLRKQIDQRVPAERKSIDERIQALEKEMPHVQKQADAMIAEGQSKVKQTYAANVKMDDREELLKKNMANLQKQLEELNAQVRQLARGLGFVFNTFKIQTLDRERTKLLGRLEGVNEDLRKVREQWKDQQVNAAASQANERLLWKNLQEKLGTLRQEYTYLTGDTPGIARRCAIEYVIDNLKTPVSDPPTVLAGSLKQMIELNIQTDNFQSALGSVAGILGVANGMTDGLSRMEESVKALVAEQTRQSAYLPPLKIDVPDATAKFCQVWDEVAAKTKDEKALAKHPADFATAMKPFLDERLTKDHIAGFFNLLGTALQRATAGWRGK